MDFTEAINKYVISHLIPGSKSHISFKSLLEEYEESFNIEKGTSEVKYRERCILKMLDRIARKLIMKEIDLKEFKQDEFSYDEIEQLVKKKLDIFDQEKPKDEDEEDIIIKKNLGILSKKDMDDKEKKRKGIDKDGKKILTWQPKEITEKEENVVKDTIDYIMDGKAYIYQEELINLLAPSLQKHKHCMEVLYRLKQFVKKRQCSLLESFETYKSYDRFKNTNLHPEEFMKVLTSIEFDISEASLYKCLD